MKVKEWWELEPISFTADRVYRMEDTTTQQIAANQTTEQQQTTAAVVDLAKAPASLEEALSQIEALKKQTNPAGAVPEWASKRIDQLTTNWRSEERVHAATKAQLAQARSEIEKLQRDGKVVTTLPPEVIEAQVQERAAQLAQAQTFNESCQKVISAGTKAFPDFAAAMAKLHQISPTMVDTPQGKVPTMSREFIEAALELDAPEKVLHELAKPEHNDEAARIMALPPARQGAALAKFGVKLGGSSVVTEISKALPPPSTAVGGSGHKLTGDLSDSKMSMADWIKEREKQAAEYASSRRRRA